MAFVTGQDKLSDKSNVLYIFDIRERIKNQDQTTGGFLIFDMVNMIEDNVTKLGFIQTSVFIEKELIKQDYLWMIIQNDKVIQDLNMNAQLENQPGKFALYSFRDQKIIYWQDIQIRLPVFDFIFEKTLNLCYIIDKQGIYKTKILYQKQSTTVSLSNFIDFKEMQKNSEYWLYKDVLGDSLTFPQSQNIYHLFSLFDLGEHLMNAFEDNLAIYCSDFQGKSPLMLSYDW